MAGRCWDCIVHRCLPCRCYPQSRRSRPCRRYLPWQRCRPYCLRHPLRFRRFPQLLCHRCPSCPRVRTARRPARSPERSAAGSRTASEQYCTRARRVRCPAWDRARTSSTRSHWRESGRCIARRKTSGSKDTWECLRLPPHHPWPRRRRVRCRPNRRYRGFRRCPIPEHLRNRRLHRNPRWFRQRWTASQTCPTHRLERSPRRDRPASCSRR